MSDNPTHDRLSSPVPGWVVLSMLLIGVLWVLVLCFGGGMLSGPTAFTTMKMMPTPTRLLDTTLRGEK